MKKIMSLALAGGILFVGIQTLTAKSSYNNKKLLEATETDCLEDAEKAVVNGATNIKEATEFAKYCNAKDVIDYLQELSAEEEAEKEDRLVEEAVRKSHRAALAARREGIYLK